MGRGLKRVRWVRGEKGVEGREGRRKGKSRKLTDKQTDTEPFWGFGIEFG